MDNTQNKAGNSHFEEGIPLPAYFASEISQCEAVDYRRYSASEPENLTKQNNSPSIASSISSLNNVNIFDAMMEEMPNFAQDLEPGICSLSAYPRASNNLEEHQEETPENVLQCPRKFQQQISTVARRALGAMALSTERIAGTNASTIRSLTPLSGTNQSSQSAYITENKGKTALHISAERGNVGIVRFLLLHGIDINTRDDSGRTALHYAAHGAYIDIVSELLVAGADIEARDNEGRSPLHAAADAECEPVIRLLVREGADLNAAIGISGHSRGEKGHYMDDYQQTITSE